MEQLQNINEYVLSQSALIGFQELLIKLILSTFLSLLIAHAYVKFSSQITPSKKYYTYISILAIIVTIIISVVKGSLALSLGLVGALSIVRFRTAINPSISLSNYFNSNYDIEYLIEKPINIYINSKKIIGDKILVESLLYGNDFGIKTKK